MNLNNLPDLCLLTIFKNHSIQQQWENRDVCTRLRALQLKLFLARKSLTLAIGPEDVHEVIQKSCFFDNSHPLHEEETRRMAKYKFIPRDLVHCVHQQFKDSFNVEKKICGF